MTTAASTITTLETPLAVMAERFARDGFLHLRSALSAAELAQLQQASAMLIQPAQDPPLRCSDYLYADTPEGRRVLHRINEVQTKHPAFLALWAHPQLLRIALALFGGDALPVAMALVLKLPGYGIGVPWHRDPAACRVQHGINFGIYLDDADEDNGMLYVIPGSHRRRTLDLPAALERHGFDLPGAIPVPTCAGDVILHSENVLHGSRQVHSRRHRRVIYLGTRSIAEQLVPDRGLDDAWIRAFVRVLRYAQRVRAQGVGAGEVPLAFEPSQPAHRVELGPEEVAETRLDGHNRWIEEERQLGFVDEPRALASSR